MFCTLSRFSLATWYTAFEIASIQICLALSGNISFELVKMPTLTKTKKIWLSLFDNKKRSQQQRHQNKTIMKSKWWRTEYSFKSINTPTMQHIKKIMCFQSWEQYKYLKIMKLKNRINNKTKSKSSKYVRPCRQQKMKWQI